MGVFAMITRTLCTGIALAVLFAGAARAEESPAADLINLVKNSDLIVIGQVLRITEGEINAELLKLGVRFRTDIAVLGVAEVLWGDPDLKAAKVNVGFPGFPKPEQPADVLVSVDLTALSPEDQLTLTALQGLANRPRPRVYVRDEWEPAIRPEDLDTWLTIFERLVAAARRRHLETEIGHDTLVNLSVDGDLDVAVATYPQGPATLR